MKATRMVVVHADIYAYRLRQSSIIRMKFSPAKLVCIDVGEKIVKDVTDYDKTLYAAACSRAFAVNYTVFLQIPPDDKESQLKVWKAMLLYRSVVARDCTKEIRFKNKVGAWCTYLGRSFSYHIGRVYKSVG